MSRRPILPGIHSGADGADDSATAVLREALSRWPTGVAVVAARDESGRLYGITVTAFVPFCLDPPLVGVSLGEQAPILAAIADRGRFVVNVLAGGQKRAANAFADTYAVGGGEFSEGDPVLRGAAAALVCVARQTHPAGDHRLVVAEVERVEIGSEASPLLYFAGDYRRWAEE